MKKLLLGLVLVLLGVSSYGVLQMEAAPTRYRNQQVVVFRGDSLWGIARRYTRPEEDVREVIDRIAKANHLDLRQAIQPGQKLMVTGETGKTGKNRKDDGQPQLMVFMAAGRGYCTCVFTRATLPFCCTMEPY